MHVNQNIAKEYISLCDCRGGRLKKLLGRARKSLKNKEANDNTLTSNRHVDNMDSDSIDDTFTFRVCMSSGADDSQRVPELHHCYLVSVKLDTSQ